MYSHAKICISTSVTNIIAIPCRSETPRPIIIDVSNAFLNIWPLTNQAYKLTKRKIIATSDGIASAEIVSLFVKRAIRVPCINTNRAWIPKILVQT